MLRELNLKFTRESTNSLTIQNISSKGILIDNELWPEIIALTTQKIIENWPNVDVSELNKSHFSNLLEYEPEIILVGTGEKSKLIPRELMFEFARIGVGLELMSTAAAARTFNVLAGEGRLVGAVLYPI
ncbi:MAG: hypothetical protein CMO97_04875 [Woeseia sp.]|nr:hypothetical protein [Woeseia sp.]|tara:strand:+ start:14754 stop:15140 length:387 start_codon:yes stop_codon:yes gene_type:complete